jgi:hypothetical protein
VIDQRVRREAEDLLKKERTGTSREASDLTLEIRWALTLAEKSGRFGRGIPH